ncbi:MAG TPA: SOS response-associated peptidase family protein [Noviherbaspirillum sp.]|uniref:SOS response-associated peptidase n=1 Tax=Noviherbaspirillum sp. TaxID=1926288 RepID=UPI002D2FE2EB|nr:SOS response-associated peptidase family protein [Noviherbaspirillum sp.]HYD95277.1 SOS response-associated peptidase family protein [Noviherbaspirillum sp.]
MCANYLPSRSEQLQQHFGVAPPDSEFKSETFPGYMAPMIRPPRADAVPGDRACALAMFGIVPHWADVKLARQTYNARSETVAAKPSFRNAWKRRQFCIVPAASFFEPNYETGKAVRWEIGDADGAPLGIAGIWEYKQDGPNGLPLLSMSMLTINADAHPVMQRFHKPDDEKRMLVLLSPEQYDEWLHAPLADAPHFFKPYPAERLSAKPAPR